MLQFLTGSPGIHKANIRPDAAQIAQQLRRADWGQQELVFALLEQTRRFQVVLENMSQGVCLFDENKRLVLSNRRYAEIYGLSPDQICPGMTLRQILTLRSATQSTPKLMSYEEYVAWVPARDSIHAPTGVIIELENGRSVAIRHQPLNDGGYVATHADVTDRLIAEAKIARMALHDPLTGLPNRALFRNRLHEATAAVPAQQNCAVLYLDLDRFKTINDTFGHPFGDVVLAAVAERLLKSTRPTDTVARLGGDEFAVLQSNLRPSDSAVGLAERLINGIEEPYNVQGHRVMIGASIGIAQAPGDGVDPDQLMRHANLALLTAKSHGRGRYRLFEREMAEAVERRRKIELDLRSALEANEFELFYQPLVDLGTGRTRTFEALLRWNSPERGLLSASEFIPLTEEMGLALEIGDWVLGEACTHAASWPDEFGVAINVSAEQLRRGALLPSLTNALRKSRLPPSRVELEITETAVIQDPNVAKSILHRLKNLGIGVVLDDFGVGCSSLSYIKEFPFDRIKIDRSFIGHLPGSATSVAIVRAVIGLCDALGIATTAEGVENEEQLAILRAERCREGQGFLFSSPMAWHDLSTRHLGRPDFEPTKQ
ncbi:MAG: EAL domain-containing protein [Alphaproteobacteria bacterium]|nr:EAL domain-containing protein [Alphaproteobacteria bacterium]